MKNLYKLVCCILALNTFSVKAQYGWQNGNNPLSNDTLLGEIEFINQDEAWISTGKGTLLHSTNGGQTWTRVNPFPNDTLFVSSDASMGMSWSDQNHGFVLATKGNGMFNSDGVVLLKTSNGGTSWTKTDVDTEGRSALQVQFVDNNNGWISMFSFANGLKILKTNDGGLNWTELPDHYITPFNFVNANDGWGVATWDDGSDTLGTHWSIVKTNNGGNSWQFVYTDMQRNVQDLLFIRSFDANTCIAEAPGKRFIKTTDGGANWTSINYPVYYNNLSKHKNFDFINLNEGWLTEDPENNSLECIVHHTTNGGQTWEVQHPGLSNGSIFNVKFFDANHGLLVGETCDNCTDSTTYDEIAVIKRYVGNGTSINNYEINNKTLVYPNPSQGVIEIKSEKAILNLECFNLTGELIYKCDVALNNSTIDLTAFNKGIYILKITTTDSTESVKLVLN